MIFVLFLSPYPSFYFLPALCGEMHHETLTHITVNSINKFVICKLCSIMTAVGE